MRGRKAIAAVLLLLFAVGLTGSLRAITEHELSSTFQTGGVNILLETKRKADTQTVPFTKPEAVVPGQEISMIPRVTNKAEPCYVRARLLIEMKKKTQHPISFEDCYGINEDWVIRGGYLYYTKPLDQGESVSICQGIKTPESWDDLTASDFQISVEAEAIQVRNLTADFEEERPWGRVQTEVSQVQEGYRTGSGQMAEGEGIDLIFEDGAKAFIVDPEEFFSNSSSLMPGDICQDTLKLKNSAMEEIQVFFKAESRNSELLKNTQLTISQGNREIYRGPLSCGALKKYSLLAGLSAGEEENIKFCVKTPEHLKNVYQELSDQVIWRFTVKGKDGHIVQTGDETESLLWAVLFLTAASVLLVLRRRSGRNHGKGL